jgi:hypothetical protein
MNYATSLVSSKKLRQIILLFLVEIAMLFAMTFGQFSNGSQAFAKPLTAEAEFHQAQGATEQPNREAEAEKYQNEKAAEKAQKNREAAAEEVEKKVDLDQATSPDARESIKRMQGEKHTPKKN